MTKREAYDILGIHNLDVSPEHLKDCYLYKMSEIRKHKDKKAFYDNSVKQIEDAYEVILESRRKEDWFCSDIDYRDFVSHPEEVKMYAPGQYYSAPEVPRATHKHGFFFVLLVTVCVILMVLGFIMLVIILTTLFA